MTDTEILNTILQSIRISASAQEPVSPARLGNWADWIEQERGRDKPRKAVIPEDTDCWDWSEANRQIWLGMCHTEQHTVTNEWREKYEKMAADVLNRAFAKPHEAFWRCKHMPSAIDNYFSRDICVHGCHAYPPTWHSNGMSELRETARECKPAT